MKKKQLIIIAALTAMALGSSYAADISNGGSSAPLPAFSIAQVTSTTGDVGIRPVEWRSATVHSVSGQSFVASKTATAGSISVLLTSLEDFTGYDVDSIELKVFEGDHITRNATALDSFVYDPTVLGDGVQNVWLEFGLDAGISMTNGNTYSFLFCFNAESTNHTFSFKRAKNSPLYPDAEELRGGNLYDIINWSTDPWDDQAPIGSSVAALGGDLFFSVNELITENIAPVADDIAKSTLQTNAVEITLSGFDANGDALTFAIQDSPTNGTLTGTAPDMTYAADLGFFGIDTFTYVANDGTTNSEPATVTITVLESSGLMSSVGADDPAISITNLIGTALAGFSREVIRTDSQTFVIGQSFTLAEEQNVSEIYIQSVNTRDFADFVGAVEIKVFSGVGGTATLEQTSIFDVVINDQAGDDVATGEWVRFTLQDGGVTLPAGENSFLVHWSLKGDGNKWGFARNKTASSYSGGVQYEFVAQSGDAYPQWDTDPWASVSAQSDKDLTFYVNTGESTVTATQLYVTWAGVNGANAADMLDDTDFDGMSELLEYALGGNPTTNDATTILPVATEDGGWMYYVYNRRDDAVNRGLTYSVLSTTDLIFGPITNATEFVAAAAAEGGFESVTNRISTATEGKQFMGLEVELAD